MSSGCTKYRSRSGHSMIQVYIVMVVHYEQPYCISVLYSY